MYFLNFRLLALLVPLMLHSAHAQDAVNVEDIHRDVWQRFVQPNGLLLDYNLPGGGITLPTPAEARSGRPNALSYWTPVENGAFFTGLYLDAVALRWERSHTATDREKVKKLADGLLLCAEVAEVPGFIARNVLPDGRSHYALGSDDQTGPWFYGLWRYLDSGAATGKAARHTAQTMATVAAALEQGGWLLPADRVGVMRATERRGSFTQPEHRAAVRRLFILRAVHAATGDSAWLVHYRKTLAGSIGGVPTIDLVRRGIEGDAHASAELRQQQLWIFVGTQAVLAELARLEDDPEIRVVYERTLARNASHVLSVATAARTAPSAAADPPSAWPNWQAMNERWREQRTGDEANQLAMEQLRHWGNSLRVREAIEVREPLAALAIVAYAGPNHQGAAPARAALDRLVVTVPWEDLYSSYGFLAELAWFRTRP